MTRTGIPDREFQCSDPPAASCADACCPVHGDVTDADIYEADGGDTMHDAEDGEAK